MLTDYERYQLEWMIEHGHSLKEFVQGLDLVDRDGIDSLEDVYAIWENDYGFGGEVFSNEREFKEEESPSMGNRPAPARRLPRWPRMWMPMMKSRKRKTSAGAVRATATQMVRFPFTTCRLIYNIGCLRHSMDRKDE